MAKRKRLEVPTEPFSPELETKSALSSKARMPIADVAGEVAGRAALEEVAREMTAAEQEGRVVKRLPLDRVALDHLSRDRMVVDPEEMAALTASLADRGQQTPIEVVQLGEGYGLISGMRRVLALRELGKTEVLAFVRRPDGAESAYRSMVEENEIRSDLSFYERANIAAAAAEQGVYPTPRAAISALFAHSSAPRRSKIAKFVTIRETLGRSLAFPAAIPEKLGLKLAAAIEADERIASRIADALRKTPPGDAAAERRTLERALTPGKNAAPARDEVLPGVRLTIGKGRVAFDGPGVDEAFLDAVRAWVVSHAKPDGSTY